MPELSPEDEAVLSAPSWMREQHEAAKARNAAIPDHARMVITDPSLSGHARAAGASTKGDES